MKKLTTTHKIIAAFIAVTIISFLLFGCETTPIKEVKTDSTEMKVDTLKLDTLK